MKPAAHYLLCPIYQLIAEQPLWWFLARASAPFLSEVGFQMGATEKRVAPIEERLRADEAINTSSAAGQNRTNEPNNIR
jgi:hypothetical protein